MGNLSKKDYKKLKKKADRRRENQKMRNLTKNDGAVSHDGISYWEDPQGWRLAKLLERDHNMINMINDNIYKIL